MRSLVFAWGILGVVMLLLQAVIRLGPLAWDAARSGLTPLQWGVGATWVVLMAHAEGWRGFHRAFSPRVVARAQWLREHPSLGLGLLAPVFCMGLLHATPRRLWTSRILLLAIVGLIVAVRQLPQPWRGIVDAGVVVGLAIGLTSLLGYTIAALRGRMPDVDLELPP